MPLAAEVTATRRSYDRVAVQYADTIGEELTGKPLDRALLSMFSELAGDGVVADIGCGPGHITRYLSDKSARIIGLDLSPTMCAIGRRTTSLPFGSADMTALPLANASLAGIVCFYAVIHLNAADRAAAYSEFARTLAPGGYALLSFHTRDEDVPAGGSRGFSEWWGIEVTLTFRFLDPVEEISMLEAAGLQVAARVDREPYPDVEHPSQRSYLLAQRPA